MNLRQLQLLALTVVIVAGFDHPAYADFISLNPKRTYLRTNSDAGSLGSTPVNLATLSFAVNPGDFLLLEGLGDFDFGPGGDTGFNLVAVFSSSSTLLASSLLNRVPGAIDAGPDVVTGPTFFGGLSTDIPEDFAVNAGVVVQVPTGAAFLFFSPGDSLYGDNTDPDGDYGVRITAAPSAVPEPSSLTLLWLGGVCVAGFAWRQRRGGQGNGKGVNEHRLGCERFPAEVASAGFASKVSFLS